MSWTMYAKELLAMHFAFDEFSHILWGEKMPIMTDNKALTRFFQANTYHKRFGFFVTRHFSLILFWHMYQV